MNLMPHYIVQGLFAMAGLTAVAASVFNWNWFFSTRSAQSLCSKNSRRRARLFYGLLGLLILGMAVFFFLETREAVAAAPL